MWPLFFHLLLSWSIGLIALYSIRYFQKRSEFDMWETLGQCITRLIIGTVVCLAIAYASKWPWLLFTLPGIAALLSNYWLPWVIKKLR